MSKNKQIIGQKMNKQEQFSRFSEDGAQVSKKKFENCQN